MLLRSHLENTNYESSSDEDEFNSYSSKLIKLKSDSQMNSIYNKIWNPILQNNEIFNMLNELPINTNKDLKIEKDNKLSDFKNYRVTLLG